LPSEQAPAERRITVGIDFGTSTTKVCARASLGIDDQVLTHALRLEGAQSGQDPHLCPSVVAFEGGHLYFGFEAERHRTSADGVFDHLKICLGCLADRQARSLPGCRSVAPDKRGCNGVFRFTLDGQGIGVLSRELATLYLAWVMNQARKQLPYELTGGDPVEIVFNVGIPIPRSLPRDDLSGLAAVYRSRPKARSAQGVGLA
jgi:molecular chaperone DnaK (HSP70)